MSYRNKFIVGIDGVDNTGKSTLVDLLNQYISSLDKSIVYVPPHFSKLSNYFPEKESDVANWLKNSPREKIVKGILNGSVIRNNLIEQTKAPYVLVDRGYFSIISCCIARLNSRLGSQEERINRVLYLANELGFEDKGELSFLLETALNDSDFISLLERRNNKMFEVDYKRYLTKFRSNLLKLFPKNGEQLDILESPETLVSHTVQSLEKVTDLKYRQALHKFINEISEERNIRSVLLTGSLSTNSIQINWSDIDLVCIMYEESNKTAEQLKKIARDTKKHYGIDITPWVVNVNKINDAIREQGKIRYVFFGKSETRCVYGVDDYLNLVSQELVTNLSFEDSRRLLEAGKIRNDNYKKGKISLSRVYVKNLKMCFNLVKSVLLGRGIFCSNYQDIYSKAKESYPHYNFEYLQILIQQKLNHGKVSGQEMKSNLEKLINFSSNFLKYIQNRGDQYKKI